MGRFGTMRRTAAGAGAAGTRARPTRTLGLVVAGLLAGTIGPGARAQAPPSGHGDTPGAEVPNGGAAGDAGAGGLDALGPRRPELARYVFLPRVDDDGVATATVGVGVGTRDTRFAGPEGVEQGVTLRVRPTSWLALEGAGQTLMRRGARLRGGGGVRALVRVLDERRAGVTVEADVGYRFDLRGDHVLGAGATLVRHFGAVETVAAARVEVPLSHHDGPRDEADLLLSAAASVPVTDWYTQGVELGAEDLEALWEPDEAEGGARVLLGPSATFQLSRDVHVRTNVSAVYAPPNAAAPDPGRAPWGVLARLALGYSFR